MEISDFRVCAALSLRPGCSLKLVQYWRNRSERHGVDRRRLSIGVAIYLFIALLYPEKFE